MNQETIKRYIEGDASSAEKEQIVAWVKADENNRKELFALHKLHDITIWQAEKKTGKRKKTATRRLAFYKASSIAAAVLIFLFAGSFYTLYMNVKKQIPKSAMQTIRVPVGQQAELVLADGTNVWLNAGSTFTFPTLFSADNREVSLDGEGYFNVEIDRNRPFIVKTFACDVKALGTVFNVQAYRKSSLFEVSLLSGVVEVSTHSRRIRLEPNTRVYLDNNELVKGSTENYDYLLWKEGVISFNNEPVEQMLNKLQRYFDTRIVIKNTTFLDKKYTGKFRTKDGIEHILKVFQLNGRFRYEKDDEQNMITIK
jgi:ferric-dicitrate binding protein FerR (iron transport regulator)